MPEEKSYPEANGPVMTANLRPMADYDLTDPGSYTRPELEADLVTS